MPEDNKLNDALLDLQKELETLKSAAELIGIARNANDKVINDTRNILEEYTENLYIKTNMAVDEMKEAFKTALDSLDASIKNAQKLINETNQNFDVSINNAKEETERIIKSGNELTAYTKTATNETINKSEELNKAALALNEASQALLNEINKIDFPVKFEKLDITLSGISTSLQNVFGRFETFETNFKDELKRGTGQISEKLDSSLKYTEEKFNKLKNKLNYIIFVNWVLIILLLFVGYEVFIK